MPDLTPPSHMSVSAFPPLSSEGPLTVQYPFPVDYYSDREVVVRSLASPDIPQGLELLPGSVFNVPVSAMSGGQKNDVGRTRICNELYVCACPCMLTPPHFHSSA